MWNLIYLYIFLFSFLLSLILTFLLRKLALKCQIVDIPRKERFHKTSTPLLGGVAIYLSFLLTILINLFLVHFLIRHPHFLPFLSPRIREALPGVKVVLSQLWAILGGATLILLLGLADDLRELSARAKLGGQILAALFLIFSGIRITFFIPHAFWNGLLTVFWVVGIINAFNFLDNMDGLSAGVALISSLIFFWVSQGQEHFFISVILLVFAGSLLGFLRYNFFPAKIFMGDSGSMFIGYMLATLTIVNTFYAQGSPTFLPVIMPLLILGVPIFDTLTVVTIRLRKHRPIFKGDTSHFSHRLVGLGMSEKQAVLFIYLVTFCVGINATLLTSVGIREAIIILLQAIVIFSIIALLEIAWTRRREKR